MKTLLARLSLIVVTAMPAMAYREPETGVFLTRDPAGFVDGPNLYAYANQNPWTKFDPEGLWLEDLAIAVPSIGIGAKSFWDNVRGGKFGSAALDAAGIVADVGAAALPAIPGGAGLAIRASRAAIAAARKVDKVATVARGAVGTVEAAAGGEGLNAVVGGASAVLGARSPMPGGRTARATREASQGLPQKSMDGLAYKRTNPKTGEGYIGATKSPERYDARRAEHDTKLGVQHDYEVLGTAPPGTKLDALEESMIRTHGGLRKEGGPLANRRHQMREERYRASGGQVDDPNK